MTYTKNNIVIEPIPIRGTGHKFQDLTGRLFSRLTVFGYAGKRGHNQHWWCECQCGVITKVSAANLQHRHSTSCGCFQREYMAHKQATHCESRGKGVTVEYAAYALAIQRCNNPNNQDYSNYGGRGIECRLTSVMDVLDTIGRRPSPRHSIDRIDVNGHYEIGNIRWSTQQEQQNNKRNNKMLTVNECTQSVAMWAREKGMKPLTIYNRLYRGWSAEDAVTQPLHTRLKYS